MWRYGRDRIVVSTSRCGRDNPGSNPGHGRDAVGLLHGIAAFIFFYNSCLLFTLGFMVYDYPLIFTVNTFKHPFKIFILLDQQAVFNKFVRLSQLFMQNCK